MVTLRPAKADDIESLLGLLNILFTLEQDFTPDREKQQRGLTLLMGSDMAYVAVAEVDNSIVGMATLQLVISTAEGGSAGVVEDVVVLKSQRGRGIGQALLNHLCDWAEQKGVSRLQLLADRDNHPALNFYAKEGWSTTRLIALRKPLFR
jgi:GNAT superfamily N-acetyltransferase